MMQEKQPLQVARCTKIINPNTEDAKYVINVKQIAKFVVGLGDKFRRLILKKECELGRRFLGLVTLSILLARAVANRTDACFFVLLEANLFRNMFAREHGWFVNYFRWHAPKKLVLCSLMKSMPL